MATWRLLGEVQPNNSNWIEYPETTITETFKITFLALPPQTSSWIWIRSKYIVDVDGVGASRRIYPKAEPEILEIPHPQGFDLLGVNVRAFEIKKGYYRRFGRVPDGFYLVRLEALVL